MTLPMASGRFCEPSSRHAISLSLKCIELGTAARRYRTWMAASLDIQVAEDETSFDEFPTQREAHVKQGLEPTYVIYGRLPDGSKESAGSFFTLEEAQIRVRFLSQKSGRAFYIYDSLKQEVVEEKHPPKLGVAS
jgi:hypothetical protein